MGPGARGAIGASALLALGLAACGDLTDGATLGACSESTRDWWPLETGARWTYRVTDFSNRVVAPLDNLPPDVDWKEHEVEGEAVPIGGLLGDELGTRMRVTDPLSSEWDLSWFSEQDEAYRWRRKLFSPLGAQDPGKDSYYLPWRTRLDYSADRVCTGSRWHESFESLDIEIGVGAGQCARATWQDEPQDCAGARQSRGSSWRVERVDATLSLFGARMFYEHALCVRRTDDDGEKDSTYCFVRGVGKVFECERLLGREVKVEELCRHCVPGGDCDWTEELPGPCSEGQWEGATCEEVFAF